jgi:hypothetical protein
MSFYLLWWVRTTCNVVLTFLTATSHGSPAVGRVDICYTLNAPCSAKIVDIAFLPFSFLISPYLTNHCATVLRVNRLSQF